MTIFDVTSRITELQSQLAVMQTPAADAAAGASFRGALDEATGTPFTPTAAASTRLVDSTEATPTATGKYTRQTALGGPTGDDVVADARRYLGVPYVWGGTDPRTGLDCSGLVQRVYRDLGHELPRVASQQATVGTAVPSLAQARPGDLLAFGSPAHHIGIYIGDGQMIEAPRPGKDVRIGPVYETPSHIRRVVDEPSTAAGSVGAAGSGAVSSDVPFAGLFNAASQKYGVSARLLAAVAHQESGYTPTAVSGAGARGLMQLMPSTAQGLGVTDPFDPAQSVDAAARMLHGLIDAFGRTDLALAAYNAGPGAVRRYNGIPPYPETQTYVRRVLAFAGGA